ncbi:uncharacterized protein LOC107219501 [Neodiprion lecontei]|uniref:Uncharacterized protein LOC107219501 n=1 Tax=Neodiprion lecontei TaxID=441921 RepID=A0A6J0BEB7_NEOLC|nr:uncharacterized protein LOC107219501 [Neodiprion lecontei]
MPSRSINVVINCRISRDRHGLFSEAQSPLPDTLYRMFPVGWSGYNRAFTWWAEEKSIPEFLATKVRNAQTEQTRDSDRTNR